VEPTLQDDERVAADFIDEPVFVIEALGPVAGQVALQWLGFSNPAEWIPVCFLDHPEEPLRQLWLESYPVLQVLERLGFKFVDDVTRALPHALGPEKSLLSSMLQDPQEYIGVAIEEKLTKEHFYLPAHSTLVRNS
jgi:hypothetical protein